MSIAPSPKAERASGKSKNKSNKKGGLLAGFFGFLAALACIVTALGYIAMTLNAKFAFYTFTDLNLLMQITVWLVRAPFIAVATCMVACGFRRKIAGTIVFIILAAGFILVALFPDAIGLAPALSIAI